MNDVVFISNTGLAYTSILLLIAAGISAFMRLGLTRSLLWGAIRCVVQLSLLGYILTWIFAVDRPELVALLVLFMCVVAAHTATRRTPNVSSFPSALAFISISVSTGFVLIIVTALVIRAEPWYTARIVIPIAGMILGNTVNGMALALDRLYAEVKLRRFEVEAYLALGALPKEAVIESMRQAMRAGMTPIINSLMVVGIVSIPGAMTGQILGGVDPAEAAKYQIVVMFMIAAAAALGSMLLVRLAYKRLFNADGALRPDLWK